MTDITVGPVVGKDCKLYYNTGTRASPTWVEIKKARDVAANAGKGEADVSNRESSWKKDMSALKTLEVNFGYTHKRGTDTVFAALLAQYLNDTNVEFAVMDGDITYIGAKGWRAFYQCFTLNQTQELENGSVWEVGIKPTWHEESSTIAEPLWLVVSA